MRPLQVCARLFLALWLALVPVKALAGSMTLLGAGKAGAAIAFSLAYTDHAEDTTGGTTISYGTKSIGAADPNRIVVVALCNRGTVTNATVASATIGGVSATQVSGALADNGATALWTCDMWQAAVPTGTTAAVSVTYNNASARSAIDLYRIVTGTPTRSDAGQATNSTGNTNCGITSSSFTVPSGGAGISMYGCRGPGSANSVTWSAPLTKDNEAIFIASAFSASSASTSTSGATTATASISAASSATPIAISAAAWGP